MTYKHEYMCTKSLFLLQVLLSVLYGSSFISVSCQEPLQLPDISASGFVLNLETQMIECNLYGAFKHFAGSNAKKEQVCS